MQKPTVIDFETDGIKRRPDYPPKPVGFSIKKPGDRRSRYYAWGHPTENNCTFEQATAVLRDAWRSDSLLFQNGKFDVDVAVTHMHLPTPQWDKIHDTLFLIFLHDPYAQTFSLKPSAERILGMKPEERDILREWITRNVPEARRKPSEWGAYISRAPGGLVGRYADGDVLRMEKLFAKLHPLICKRNMEPAYDRERRLMPVLLKNERSGIRVDLPLLETDYVRYCAALEAADNWLRKTLKSPNMNIDSDRELADALECSGVVTQFNVTEKGNRSVSKKNLTPDMFNNRKVSSVLQYRNMLSTCLHTFMEVWLEQARLTGGYIFTSWNQVRSDRGDKSVGAKTGRMSSTPNFQNIPKNWKKAVAEGYVPPEWFKALPPLPLMRRYFLPDWTTHRWGRRDYNQQELRILAHFEDGDMLAQYNANPRFDHHQQVKDLLVSEGFDLPRDSVKILNFQDIYGGGDAALCASIKCTVQQSKDIKRAKRRMLPDFAELEASIKARGKAGLTIRTWGGREYFTEPPHFVKKYNRVMSFEYKLLNYLIQGSAADCTKESIIRYDAHPKAGPNTGDARFLLSVHDENNISVEEGKLREEMQLLKEIMQSVEFDAPMLSDGEYGPSWGALQACDWEAK